MHDRYIERILTARVYDVAVETPLDRAPQLSARLGNTVLIKREDLQPIFSFKLRGAYNKLSHMDADQRRRGVVCASAGNHAQGVALAAQKLGCRAVVVMPTTTPAIKSRAVAALGGEVVMHGEDYDAAFAHARAYADRDGLALIHPFDDPDVIAGQGTIGMEMLRQHGGPVDAIFLPVGGGGLAAGVATYVKYLYPQVRVIGVEPADAASMKAALTAGRRVALDAVGTFADGVAVRQVGEETLRLCRAHLNDVITVDTDELCAGIKDLFNDTRAMAEPAGAVGIAGLKKYVEQTGARGETLVTINSGANLNFDRLVHVAERANIGEHAEAVLAVDIPERAGSFLAFLNALGERPVTEFSYRYGNRERAHLFVGLYVAGDRGAGAEVVRALSGAGYKAMDLSDNELAKLHVRHMVGGSGAGLADERLLRFRFPERPGALLDFLRAVGGRWNISLFHYRNDGSNFGRVLAGIQVPEADDAELRRHLDDLGYAWWDETANPAYRVFLAD
ncbi:MAG: threonine ammonia-lyase, biosynthetic [Pseudomonadota bacterium]